MRAKIIYAREVRYEVDGKPVSKAEFDKAVSRKISLERGLAATALHERSKCWPRKSDSLGVHTTQCTKAEEQAAKLGVPTEFDKKTGQAIIRSNAHQRDLQKALGYINLDGGYGTITG